MPDLPRRTLSTGAGRVLVFVYGLLGFSAVGRSSVQLSTKFHEAPLAYLLSAFAAIVYCVAAWALATDRWRVALPAVLIELVGVVVVGLFTVLVPSDFPDATVWSKFGIGYGFVPAVLPLVGLWWLRRTRSGVTNNAPSGADSGQRRD